MREGEVRKGRPKGGGVLVIELGRKRGEEEKKESEREYKLMKGAGYRKLIWTSDEWKLRCVGLKIEKKLRVSSSTTGS